MCWKQEQVQLYLCEYWKCMLAVTRKPTWQKDVFHNKKKKLFLRRLFFLLLILPLMPLLHFIEKEHRNMNVYIFSYRIFSALKCLLITIKNSIKKRRNNTEKKVNSKLNTQDYMTFLVFIEKKTPQIDRKTM